MAIKEFWEPHSLLDIVDVNGDDHVVIAVFNDHLYRTIPLREYLERNVILEDIHGEMFTIEEYLEKMMERLLGDKTAMRVKKLNGKVYGADFTAAEKKAMAIEIKKQLADWDEKHYNELDAIVLWVLHEQFGFGETRLKRFHDNFVPAVKELIKRYEMDDTDDVWLCTYKLKQHGIDISKWNEE